MSGAPDLRHSFVSLLMADWKTPAADGWAVPGSNRGPPACKGAQGANERARNDTQRHEDPANQLEEQMRVWSDEEPG